MFTSVELPTNLYGHSKVESPIETWQLLDQHLNGVASRARNFAKSFNSENWGWVAGLLHDLGKVDSRFQRYLREENDLDDPAYDEVEKGRVNHSSAGAALAEEWFNQSGKPFGRVLAYMIAGHHAGLPDFHTESAGRGALMQRLADGREKLRSIEPALMCFRSIRDLNLVIPSFVKSDNFHFWVRMLFSCLVDADFIDTEEFVAPERAAVRPRCPDLQPLQQVLKSHLNALMDQSLATGVNTARQDVLRACRKAASHTPGLFTLSVPTGGGKTLSSLAFALDHAVFHGKKRVIYVIPYTSIIEQTVQVFRSIFGDDEVVEHHSNLDPAKETLRSSLAAENWDAPIIVTTNVQFFESLFSSRPSRCRKLHNLIESVVVLDEAQLVPPEKLDPCIAALKELSANYGTSIVLCTATQPDFAALGSVTEIVPESLNLRERLRRVTVEFPTSLQSRMSWQEIASELSSQEQVLCIVNSRRDCYELFKLMPPGTFHLSTLMCGEHRSQVIAEIKQRLRYGQSIRVVSTQLVEAGVDIDFPAVHRALCGLDSIAQSAGRCNREGRLASKGRLKLFIPPTVIPGGLLRKGEVATRELFETGKIDFELPETLRAYFRLFYSKINDTGRSFLDNLKPASTQELDVPFRTVGATFRLIDDSLQSAIFVRYADGAELIERLRDTGPSRALLRKLQRFTLSVPTFTFQRLLQSAFVEEVWPGFFAQSYGTRYDARTGLDVFSQGWVAEDFVV